MEQAASEQAYWAEVAARDAANAAAEARRARAEEGVCDCCGQRFVERTRRHPDLGKVWTELLSTYSDSGICPRCYNDFCVLRGFERDWTSQERLEHERRKKQEAEDARRAAEEARRRLDEEEAKKAEAQRRAEEEARRKSDEEEAKKAEAQRRAGEKERQRLAELAAAREEEERRARLGVEQERIKTAKNRTLLLWLLGAALLVPFFALALSTQKRDDLAAPASEATPAHLEPAHPEPAPAKTAGHYGYVTPGVSGNRTVPPDVRRDSCGKVAGDWTFQTSVQQAKMAGWKSVRGNYRMTVRPDCGFELVKSGYTQKSKTKNYASELIQRGD